MSKIMYVKYELVYFFYVLLTVHLDTYV